MADMAPRVLNDRRDPPGAVWPVCQERSGSEMIASFFYVFVCVLCGCFSRVGHSCSTNRAATMDRRARRSAAPSHRPRRTTTATVTTRTTVTNTTATTSTHRPCTNNTASYLTVHIRPKWFPVSTLTPVTCPCTQAYPSASPATLIT